MKISINGEEIIVDPNAVGGVDFSIRDPDVVRVVRCEACKFWKGSDRQCAVLTLYTPPLFYCETGERKE